MTTEIPLVWQYVALGIATLLLVVLLLWLYNRRERRRKHALELARLMTAWGLDWFAEGYEMYAVGDYSGLAYKVSEIVKAVRSDAAMVARLDGVFWKLLDHYRDDAAKVAEIRKRLGK